MNDLTHASANNPTTNPIRQSRCVCGATCRISRMVGGVMHFQCENGGTWTEPRDVDAVTTEQKERRILEGLSSPATVGQLEARIFWSFGYVALSCIVLGLRRRNLIQVTLDGRFQAVA